MSASLPSLRGIEAFIKAAETLSFQDAARKLNVTASAISRRISEFEQQIGFPLFVRNPRSIRLTRAGEQYLRDLAPAYDTLKSVTSAARYDHRIARLRVAAFPSYCAEWLQAELNRGDPGLAAKIDLFRIEHRTALDRTADITIWGGPKTTMLRPGSEKLFDLSLSPICRPEYIEAGVLTDPRQLLDSTLLGFRFAPDAWPRWFDCARVALTTTDNVIPFATPAAVIEAALEGVGIGLADAVLARSYVECGLLVRPFHIHCDYPRSVYMLVQNDRTDRQLLNEFCQWVRRVSHN